MSFFQFLDYEIDVEDITDPYVQNKNLLDEIKVTKLKCTVRVSGESDNGGFGFQESIPLSDVEDMIETAREKGTWRYAMILGFRPGQYPHPIIDKISFEISHINTVYYQRVI